MTEPDHHDIVITVRFDAVPEGWLMSEIEIDPAVRGLVLGRIADVLRKMSDGSLGTTKIRGGIYTPGLSS